MSARNENKRANLIFVSSETANQFKCAVCRNIMVDPADVGCKNQHLFCCNCIQQIPVSYNAGLYSLFRCPICRAMCMPSNRRKMPFIERQIQSLQVKCKNHEISAEMANLMSKKDENKDEQNRKRPKKKSKKSNDNRSRSRSRSRERNHNSKEILTISDDDDDEIQQYVCNWIGSLADYENGRHLCDFDIVECKQCQKKVMRKVLHEYHALIKCDKCTKSYIQCEKHLCPKEKIKCSKCGDGVLREGVAMHLNYFCLEQHVECEYKKYGCFYPSFKRKEKEKHEKRWMDYHLKMVKSKCDSLQSDVLMNKVKITSLECRLLKLERK